MQNVNEVFFSLKSFHRGELSLRRGKSDPYIPKPVINIHRFNQSVILVIDFQLGSLCIVGEPT